jgi:two-component system sensor histidine kinase PilS (NtrC family)
MFVAVTLVVVTSLERVSSGRGDGWVDLPLPVQLSVIYVALAFVGLLLVERVPRGRLLQLIAQVFVDLVMITALFVSAGGPRSGLTMLYLFPVAGGALLAPRLYALLFAALASIAILAEAIMRSFGTQVADASLLAAALTGALCFAVALALQWLGERALRQAELARERGSELERVERISARILEELPTGLVVLEPDGRIRQCNQAAARWLRLDRQGLFEQTLPEVPELSPLHRWLAEVAHSDAIECATTLLIHGTPIRLQLSQPADLGGVRLITLDNAAHAEQRAEQLKLAALGRLTAGIAHEVRNPLAAIAHASALLAEEASSPLHLRMLRIIRDNTQRLDRLVEDILALGRRDRSPAEELDLDAAIQLAAIEIAGAQQDCLKFELDSGVAIRFNAGHLRQLVHNLVSNALRHSSGATGAVTLRSRLSEAGPQFDVLDDGPGIPPERRQHLFEPFFTTQPKGTGLGLYLAREFCLANGAALSYGELEPGRLGFRIQFEHRPSRPS